MLRYILVVLGCVAVGGFLAGDWGRHWFPDGVLELVCLLGFGVVCWLWGTGRPRPAWLTPRHAVGEIIISRQCQFFCLLDGRGEPMIYRSRPLGGDGPLLPDHSRVVIINRRPVILLPAFPTVDPEHADRAHLPAA